MNMVQCAWDVLTHFTLNLLAPCICLLIVFDFIGSLIFNKR